MGVSPGRGRPLGVFYDPSRRAIVVNYSSPDNRSSELLLADAPDPEVAPERAGKVEEGSTPALPIGLATESKITMTVKELTDFVHVVRRGD